jgi:hypothetical protein
MQVKHGIGRVWLVVIGLGIAAVIVVVLAIQGGSQAPSAPAKVQTQTQLNGAATSGAADQSQSRADHLICARCAP